MPLRKLRALRDDMVAKEKAVVVFRFTYKAVDYFVAVCLLTDDDRKKDDAKYALVRLCFVHADGINNYLDCYANSKSITAGMTELRSFLGVEYQKDGIGWIEDFLSRLEGTITREVPRTQDTKEYEVILHTICRHEKRNPNRIYRNYVFRNGMSHGKQKHRTEYNAQLAAVRFPSLYKMFKEDKTISFAFSEDAATEKSEEEILSNFEKNESKR